MEFCRCFAGSDIIKMLVVANELLVPACESKCILLLKEVSKIAVQENSAP